MTASAPGRLKTGPRRYDLRLWLRARGRQRAFLDEVTGLARLTEGESVLDVGCGTGTVALATKRRVGPDGVVHGIDPSGEFIARARAKAAAARLDVGFEIGVAQSLPFRDAMFDVVIATLMLHHVSADARQAFVGEVGRVLTRGGRVLAVDLDLSDPDNPRRGPHMHAHRGGAHFDLSDVAHLFVRDGFAIDDHGPVSFRFAGFERMRYVLVSR